MKLRILLGLVIALALGCSKTTTVIPFNAQLEKDVAIIKQYLADHNIVAEKDTTGVMWVIHTLGTGVKPSLSNCIRIKYEGRLLSDESVFDSNENIKFSLSGLIAGWQIAFPHFPQGTKATIYIPSGYAYGTSASTNIPANSNLIFDIELFDVYAYNSAGGYCYTNPILPLDVQVQKDDEVIDAYLAGNNISAQTDPSGIRYTIQTLGTGAKATTANCVKIKYTGKLLADGSVFDTNITFKSPLIRYIEGLKKGLALVPAGSKVTFYIPSALAYGTTGSGSRIPPNANLIFEVEVLELTDYNAAADYCN